MKNTSTLEKLKARIERQRVALLQKREPTTLGNGLIVRNDYKSYVRDWREQPTVPSRPAHQVLTRFHRLNRHLHPQVMKLERVNPFIGRSRWIAVYYGGFCIIAKKGMSRTHTLELRYWPDPTQAVSHWVATASFECPSPSFFDKKLVQSKIEHIVNSRKLILLAVNRNNPIPI